VAVVEGAARAVADRAGLVELVRADASGDDAIVETAAGLDAAGAAVTVVTSDVGLADRVERRGATVQGARWVLDLLG
jgi:rRNA-processing protein FCF1